MKEILQKLYNHETLDQESAYTVLEQITRNEYSPSQIASFLSAFIMRQPTLEELKGFRKMLMDACTTVCLQEFKPIDIVGTGGDGKHTFNISTLSSIIVAAAGIKVAKHGNYSASSVSGSSDVLEYLGYKFTADEGALKKSLESNHICFLHAPLFHPLIKNVAATRKEIGQRTFFNLLGPVINPASPKTQILGVSNLTYARLYNYLLQDLSVNFKILHGLDGYDEISLTAAFKVISPKTEIIYEPEDLGFKRISPQSIEIGKDIASAATIFLNILKNEGSKAHKQVVTANSGFAIHAVYPEKTLEECFASAKEALESKQALKIFKQIIE